MERKKMKRWGKKMDMNGKRSGKWKNEKKKMEKGKEVKKTQFLYNKVFI